MTITAVATTRVTSSASNSSIYALRRPDPSRGLHCLKRQPARKASFDAEPAGRCPTDAICLVLAFAARFGHPLAPEADAFVAPEILNTAFNHLERLIEAGDPRALDWNPIQTYVAMQVADSGIVYYPLAFGYSRYARRGRPQLILATDIAGPGADAAAGALLGGAGCGLTHSCRDVDAAVTYRRWLHHPAVQKGA